MKQTVLVLSLLLLTGSVASYASSDQDQLIPAGSIVSCMVAEGGAISSKTTAVGDPVLCTLNPVEKYGRGQFPYGSYLEGRFEEYKDPGHFVGKGWMYLKFDRMYVGNKVYPVSAKVVETPGYKVSADGKILGKGHATRDTIEWLIPVLWPIDLINLPRRGPRPVLKPETRLTLELMDDLGIPASTPPRREIVVQQQQPQVVYVQPPPPPPVYVRPPVVYGYPYGYRYYPGY
jgi:hypothetical protein